MRKKVNQKPLLLIAWFSLVLILAGGEVVHAASGRIPPPGFALILQSYGVEVYRKDYPGGNPDFVQVVHLNLRARVRFYHAPIVQPREEKGAYGGPDPRFESRLLEQYWKDVSQEEPNLFCMTNGSFFYMAEYPTRLAFPLKIDGRIITDGFGYNTYEGEKLMLELWSDHAEISPFSPQRFYASRAENVMVGLSETANKRAKYSVGRTFVGVADENEDGEDEILLIFNTLTATQQAAAEVLREFGAKAVMMLDGGGSTQLICEGQALIHSERAIPQVMGVIAGDLPPVSAEWVDLPNQFYVISGDILRVEGTLRNNGVIPWTPGKTRLAIAKSAYAGKRWYDFDRVVAPGERAPFSFSITPPALVGVHTLRLDWFFSYNEETFWLEPMELRVIVQPRTPTREVEKAVVEVFDHHQGNGCSQATRKDKTISLVAPSLDKETQDLSRIANLWWIPVVVVFLGSVALFFALRLRWVWI